MKKHCLQCEGFLTLDFYVAFRASRAASIFIRAVTRVGVSSVDDRLRKLELGLGLRMLSAVSWSTCSYPRMPSLVNLVF